jgi:phospholipase C
MSRIYGVTVAVLFFVLFLSIVGCAGGAMNAPGASTPTPTQSAGSAIIPTPAPAPTPATSNTAGISAVNHIIFLAEENRGFLHYFGKLDEYRASQGLSADVLYGIPDDCSSANSDWTVACSLMNKSPNANGVPTTPIYAFHLKTQCIEGLSPDWIVAHWDFNAENPSSDTPAMDGFVISAASAAIANNENDTQGIRAMGFYNATDLPYHYWLATQFATSDTWFSPVPARTPANRYYMIAATSGGYAYPVGSGEPSIKAKTIFDLLDAAGVSWKIYTESGFTYASFFSGFSTRYNGTGHIVTDPGFAQFIADAQSGNLPQVVYIEKPDSDEKPITNVNIQDGVAESRKLINAVMYGPSWKDSVMILTFDEFGGLFDYVSPPTNVPSPDGIQPLDICTGPTDPRCSLAALSHPSPPYDPPGDFTRYGFRVPLIVISPFTKPHYVSHVTTDYTAWLKFVETRFGLPSLTARDGWTNTSDMTDFFNFQNPPWATPPQNAPSDSTGQCYDGLP